MADHHRHHVMEEREEELIVSPQNSTNKSLRKAHFLAPSVTSIDGPVSAPSLTHAAAATAKTHKDLPLNVNFLGWRHPQENWKTWVHQMHALHHSTWRRAGILDAIMNSTLTIHRHDHLIFGLVEKWWCPKTNTFAFPWGEATVTLEDMMVLGGYSVVGDSVLITLKEKDMLETAKGLHNARWGISSSKANKADHGQWMARFRGSGDDIEHEAFLAYWLSRFVFPLSHGCVTVSVVPLAVHLARGTKIALAPAVLACVYRNLALLKAAVSAAREFGTKKGGKYSGLGVTVRAPLALVQVWAWERFPFLYPKPNSVGPKETRLARWHDLKRLDVGDLRLKVDSAGEKFLWRPYGADASKVYGDEEYWALVDSDMDEDLRGFVRCVRTSELVGLERDCVEQYLPHRVARQFGMDQDLPGHVARVNVNSEVAWENYTRPIRDETLYVPSMHYEAGVTVRYSKWWQKLKLVTEVGGDEKGGSDERNEGFKPRKAAGTQSPLSSKAGLSRKSNTKRAKRRSVESSSSDEHNASVSLPRFAPSISGSDEKVAFKLSGGKDSINSLCEDNAQAHESRHHLSSPEDNGNINEATLALSDEPVESQGKNAVVAEASEGWSDGLALGDTSEGDITPVASLSRKASSIKRNKLKCVKCSPSSSDRDTSISPPPGFAPKHRNMKSEDSGISGTDEKVEFKVSAGGESCAEQAKASQDHLSARKCNENIDEPAESEAKNTRAREALHGWRDAPENTSGGDMKDSASTGEAQSSSTTEAAAGKLGLEERIRIIEKLCAWLEVGKLQSCLSFKRK